MFGSDWPFANAAVVAEAVKTYLSQRRMPATQREAIDRGNALVAVPAICLSEPRQETGQGSSSGGVGRAGRRASARA